MARVSLINVLKWIAAIAVIGLLVAIVIELYRSGKGAIKAVGETLKNPAYPFLKTKDSAGNDLPKNDKSYGPTLEAIPGLSTAVKFITGLFGYR